LVATTSTSTGESSRATTPGRATHSPSVSLLTRKPFSAITAAVSSRATTVT
jgi:hypothetical protein